MASYYDAMIREEIEAAGVTGIDPRHVEAFMRLEHGTLDALRARAFRREVRAAVACIQECGLKAAEQLAQSYWLRAPKVPA